MTKLRIGATTIALCSAMTLPLSANPAASLGASLGAGTDAMLVDVQLVDDIGASERVEAAAFLRILSQEAANAACHMSYGVAPKQSRKLMQEAKGKFTLILDALEHGNPTMNIIGAESRRKTLEKISALRAGWEPLHNAAVTLLDDPSDKAALAVIKSGNEDVLAAASLLTSEIAGQYSNPAELLQNDVMLLDFTSRQAMQTQKMGKIACEIWAGNRSDDRTELLSKTMQTYELTLGALLNGMPAVGILPAPTPEIEAALVKASADWGVIKAELTHVMTHEDVSEEAKVTLFTDLNAAMYAMEALEKKYVTFSKHNYDEDAVEGDGVLMD